MAPSPTEPSLNPRSATPASQTESEGGQHMLRIGNTAYVEPEQDSVRRRSVCDARIQVQCQRDPLDQDRKGNRMAA